MAAKTGTPKAATPKKPASGKSPSAAKKKAAGKKRTSNGAANFALLQSFAEAIRGLAAEIPSESALDRAQDLMYEAWEEPSEAKRVALARKALSISSDCADAHTLLADCEPEGSDAALEGYRRAVAAGEAALGPDAREEYEGGFWGFLETRPYMRARAALANCLRARGDIAGAVDEYRAMMELNPNDNQGNRYILMCLLHDIRAETELSDLLARYPEHSPFWTYSDTLASFRKEGPTAATLKRLKSAIKSNPHVPAYLLGTTKLPALPDFYSPGDASEAVIYATDALSGWKSTQGALEWLAEQPLLEPPRRCRAGAARRT